MKQFTLYLGSSENDTLVKSILEAWCVGHPHVSVQYESIHVNPTAAVRFGITHLPALVTNEQLIVQGTVEDWLTTFLDQFIAQDKLDN